MSSSKITLFFASGSDPELTMVEFLGDCAQIPIISYRGIYGPTNHITNSFKWTPAVHALSIFFAKAVVLSEDHGEEYLASNPVLSGERSSISASIAFSIAKKNSWLLDMFGVEVNGSPILKKILHISNSELKRPGPVTLGLKTNRLSAKNITLVVDGKVLYSREHIAALTHSLESRWKGGGPHRRKITNSFPNSKQELDIRNQQNEFKDINEMNLDDSISETLQSFTKSNPIHVPFCNKQTDETYGIFDNLQFHEFLKSILYNEISLSLQKTDIFSSKGIHKITNSIATSIPLKQLCKRPDKFWATEQFLNNSNQLGVFQNEKLLSDVLKNCEPIVCHATPAHAGTLAILYFLKFIKGYNITIEYQFTDTMELLKNLKSNSYNDQPDICTLAIAASAAYLGSTIKSPYSPFLFMPATSYSLVSSKQGILQSKSTGQRFLFFGDDITVSSMYFGELGSKGVINSKKVGANFCHPSEVMLEFEQCDPELLAILWFPHAQINSLIHNCFNLDPLGEEGRLRHLVMFAHDDFLSDPLRSLCFNIAIRDAWLLLRNNPQIRKCMSLMIANDSRFCRCVSRFSGVELLQQTKAQQ